MERSREKVQEGADRAKREAQSAFHDIGEGRAPSGKSVLGVLALLAVGATVLTLGGLTIGGILLTLLVLSPILIPLSPILVPAAIFTVGGVITAVVSTIAIFYGVTRGYNFLKGAHPGVRLQLT